MKRRTALSGLACLVTLGACTAPPRDRAVASSSPAPATRAASAANPAQAVGSGAGPEVPTPSDADVARLAAAIAALGPRVSAGEAARAARIAYRYPLHLARDWGAVDPPYIHNLKVLWGLKPRGTCWHFAEDLQRRLDEEAFRTLTLHRALAPPTLRLDHAAVVVTARGQPMRTGLVLDAWRVGQGRLYWVPVMQDDRYAWQKVTPASTPAAPRSPV